MEDLKQVVAKNITTAREQAGLTQAESARRLGIDRPRLIGMERGERPVDAAMLVGLAHLYRTSASALLSQVSVRSPAKLRFRGCEEGGLSSEEAASVRRFEDFCRSYARLLGKGGLKPRLAKIPDIQAAASSRTRRYALEGDAADLRQMWGLGETAPVGTDIFDLLSEHGIAVYLAHVESSSLAGVSLHYPGLGSAVMVNTKDTPQRQAFTAVHELAHLIYHLRQNEEGDCYISKKLDRSAEEQLANDFASAFLMPETGIKVFLARRDLREEQVGLEDVIALQRHFRVSYAAMLVRLKKLGIVKGGKHFDELREVQPVLEAQRLGYPVQLYEYDYRSDLERPRGLPEEYVTLVLRQLEAGELSEGRAAECLEMNREELNHYLMGLKKIVQGMAFDDEFRDAEVSVGG